MVNIGNCTAFQAELWGLLHGLRTAWELGLRRIVFEIDARAVYNLMIKPKRCMNHHEPLVRQIHQMTIRE
ncbi:hypothetical protein AHAS_Ahas03G0015900 [Arachis hypogaea]